MHKLRGVLCGGTPQHDEVEGVGVGLVHSTQPGCTVLTQAACGGGAVQHQPHSVLYSQSNLNQPVCSSILPPTHINQVV